MNCFGSDTDGVLKTSLSKYFWRMFGCCCIFETPISWISTKHDQDVIDSLFSISVGTCYTACQERLLSSPSSGSHMKLLSSATAPAKQSNTPHFATPP